MQPYVIHNRWALGDTVALSGVVRDLNLTYPGKYRISMAGSYSSYWRYFPYVYPLDPNLNAPVIQMEYDDGIRESASGVKQHFVTFFHKKWKQRTGIDVPVLYPKGEIFLGPNKNEKLVEGRYWVVVAGGKVDMTAKWWLPSRFQGVVDTLLKCGINCVQAGAAFTRNVHPVLNNVKYMVGATDDIADLFRLIYHAEGVICGITSFMHIAAAFNKPCVVLAGGREEWWWEGYSNHGQFPATCAPVKVPHKFLHTIGQMDCCKTSGCWKKRTVPIDQTDLTSAKAKLQLCVNPIRDREQPVPECLDRITVDHVVEKVMEYYEDGTLPPISQPSRKYSVENVLPVENTSKTPNTLDIQKPVKTVVTVKTAPPPPERQDLSQESTFDLFGVMDNPYIGGKFTVFVLCYGDHTELAKTCIEGILKTLPKKRLDLRIGLNAVCQSTLDFVQSLGSVVTKIYNHPENAKKYPVMREMFRDPSAPITTPYLVWFDDDTKIVDPMWAQRLSETIIANHREGSRLYGTKMYHDLRAMSSDIHRPDLWFRNSDWYRNVQLRLPNKQMLATNGSCIDFAVGYFWALATETMKQANIPDVRLNHNGGDITIGAQVHQVGGKIKDFNAGKKHVWCPTKEKGGRRGYSETFPWGRT